MKLEQLKSSSKINVRLIQLSGHSVDSLHYLLFDIDDTFHRLMGLQNQDILHEARVNDLPPIVTFPSKMVTMDIGSSFEAIMYQLKKVAKGNLPALNVKVKTTFTGDLIVLGAKVINTKLTFEDYKDTIYNWNMVLGNHLPDWISKIRAIHHNETK